MANIVTTQQTTATPKEAAIQTPEAEFASAKRMGLGLAFLVFGVFGVWAAVAPIEGASHAAGIVTVKSYTKVVQHLEGGIISQIKAQNGDMVNAGDVLLVLDDTQALSQLEIVTGQLAAYSALEARLIAERDNRDSVTYPASLTTTAANAQAEIAAQDHVFTARKNSLDGAVAVLTQRIGQLKSRLDGLQALAQSKATLATSYEDELADLRKLVEQGYADKQRLRELERSHTVLLGEIADLKATTASTEIQVGETQLQIIQQNNEFQSQVVNQLAETQSVLKDARERFTALTDIVQRKEIKAPVAGIVNGLQVHTEGGVIPPGATIAEIVPQAEELIIEARVSPADIDRVEIGQETKVTFSAFSRKTAPSVFGTVIAVSADAMEDRSNGQRYYLARIELTPESIAELDDVVLVPGMPADVFIHSGARSFLQYVIKPISGVFSKSLIED